jgi:hypothetical protein
VLRDERLPYEVYELWRSTGPQDGVRLRRNGALVRTLPDRPRAYVVEGARVGAILWGVDRFSVVDI